MKRILIEHVSKSFTIGTSGRQSTLAHILSFFGREQKRSIEVLSDVSLSINAGEFVSVVGPSGCGKSTLLRIIAGIYYPEKGNVHVHGKVISLINIGVGLKDRLTMKENIFLVGSLFGLSQKEITRKYSDIVSFSELQEFENTKIYQFSVGMALRLAFSIAMHSNPEILLLDEVFEVGDEIFKKKSAQKIKELVLGGACVVSVGHDLEAIAKYCNKVLWLDKGHIKAEGESSNVLQSYRTSQ